MPYFLIPQSPSLLTLLLLSSLPLSTSRLQTHKSVSVQTQARLLFPLISEFMDSPTTSCPPISLCHPVPLESCPVSSGPSCLLPQYFPSLPLNLLLPPSLEICSGLPHYKQTNFPLLAVFPSENYLIFLSTFSSKLLQRSVSISHPQCTVIIILSYHSPGRSLTKILMTSSS